MEKGSKVNEKKKKKLCIGKRTFVMEASQFPCSVCCKSSRKKLFYASNITVGKKRCSEIIKAHLRQQ